VYCATFNIALHSRSTPSATDATELTDLEGAGAAPGSRARTHDRLAKGEDAWKKEKGCYDGVGCNWCGYKPLTFWGLHRGGGVVKTGCAPTESERALVGVPNTEMDILCAHAQGTLRSTALEEQAGGDHSFLSF